VIAHRIEAELQPDPARVIARLFLPGEELHGTSSRASQVVGRVMSLAEDEVERLAAALRRSASKLSGAPATACIDRLRACRGDA
jgi:hypothetical protein